MEKQVSKKIFDILVSKDFNVETFTSTGKAVTDLAEVEMFSFNFENNGTDMGNVIILLNADKELVLFSTDAEDKQADAADKGAWQRFLKHMRMIAKRNMLGFKVQNINQVKYAMQSMASAKINEAYHGSTKTSYNNKKGKTRIIIKHNKKIGEDDKRYRHINSIFIENAAGERFKLPFTKLPGARAMARHVEEGGTPYDDFGSHITEMVEDIGTLSGFVRRSKMFEDDADTQAIAQTGRNHYQSLRKGLSQIAGKRGYHTFKENWTPAAHIEESDDDVSNLRGKFTKKSINQKVDNALPLLARLQKQLTKESTMKELSEFEEWANNIIGEEIVTELDMRTVKGTKQVEDFKGYEIHVRPLRAKQPGLSNVGQQKQMNKVFIAFAYDTATRKEVKEFKAKGSTRNGAVAALQEIISAADDKNHSAENITSQSTIDFNVMFTTHLLKGEEEIWTKIIDGPTLVIAGDEILALDDTSYLKQDGFSRSGIRNPKAGEGAAKLLGSPLKANAQSTVKKHGRYLIGDETSDNDGNRVFPLSLHSTVRSKEEKYTLNKPSLTIGTTDNKKTESIEEGSWAMPDSEDKIAALSDFMSVEQPVGVDAENATSALYDIVGDDSLFDALQELAENDPEADARIVLHSWIEDRYNARDGFTDQSDINVAEQMYHAVQSFDPFATQQTESTEGELQDRGGYETMEPMKWMKNKKKQSPKIQESSQGISALSPKLAHAILNDQIDLYDTLQGPSEFVSTNDYEIIQTAYNEASIDYGLHADDDHEEILDKIFNEIYDIFEDANNFEESIRESSDLTDLIKRTKYLLQS